MVNYEKVIEKILEKQYWACRDIKCANCCVLDECCHVFGDIYNNAELLKGEE